MAVNKRQGKKKHNSFKAGFTQHHRKSKTVNDLKRYCIKILHLIKKIPILFIYT